MKTYGEDTSSVVSFISKVLNFKDAGSIVPTVILISPSPLKFFEFFV